MKYTIGTNQFFYPINRRKLALSDMEEKEFIKRTIGKTKEPSCKLIAKNKKKNTAEPVC